MPISPQEQSMLNELKNQFRIENHGQSSTSFVQDKIIKSLTAFFDGTDIKTADQAKAYIKSEVTGLMKELTTEISSAKNKSAVTKAEGRLKDAKEFDTVLHYDALGARLQNGYDHPVAAEPVKAVESAKPTADKEAAAPSLLNAKETAGLQKSRDQFAATKRSFNLNKPLAILSSATSDFEKDILKNLEEAYSKPGQAGTDVIARAYENAVNIVAEEAIGKSSKVQSLLKEIDKAGGLEKVQKTLDADKGILETLQRTDSSKLEKKEKRKHESKIDEKKEAIADNPLTKKAAEEDKIRKEVATERGAEVSLSQLMDDAKKAGFPEKSDTVFIDRIKAADGSLVGKDGKPVGKKDGKLDKAELQALIVDPQFVDAMNAITAGSTAKVYVNNKGDDSQDLIKIGDGKNGGTLTLSGSEVALDDASFLTEGGDVEIVPPPPPTPQGAPASKAAPVKKSGGKSSGKSSVRKK